MRVSCVDYMRAFDLAKRRMVSLVDSADLPQVMIAAADGATEAIVVKRGVAVGDETASRRDTLRPFRAARPRQ